MQKFKFNKKTLLTLFVALTMPTILSAATSFASVSPVETPSTANNVESQISNIQEENKFVLRLLKCQKLKTKTIKEKIDMT